MIKCACGCDEEIPLMNKWRSRRKYINGHQQRGRLNVNYGKSGKLNPNWKGGSFVKEGYIMTTCIGHPRAKDGRYVYEHDLVMEKYLDRYLMTDEIVHHKDGNKSNNDLENLELMSRGKHSKHHTANLPRSKMGRFESLL